MEQKIQIGKKSSDLEPGYVWAPYIPMTTSQVIVEYGSKNTSRKRKINKIFNLGLDIKDGFSSSKSIMSRYSKKIINNNFYGTIEIKNPL
jgi:hypothetical protein